MNMLHVNCEFLANLTMTLKIIDDFCQKFSAIKITLISFNIPFPSIGICRRMTDII